jgi:hypothetical protein
MERVNDVPSNMLVFWGRGAKTSFKLVLAWLDGGSRRLRNGFMIKDAGEVGLLAYVCTILHILSGCFVGAR